VAAGVRVERAVVWAGATVLADTRDAVVTPASTLARSG
jgi:hypothetical protein